MSAPHILIEPTGAVLRLTLNRPEARNALSEAMIASLTRAIDTAIGTVTLQPTSDGPVRVVTTAVDRTIPFFAGKIKLEFLDPEPFSETGHYENVGC